MKCKFSVNFLDANFCCSTASDVNVNESESEDTGHWLDKIHLGKRCCRLQGIINFWLIFFNNGKFLLLIHCSMFVWLKGDDGEDESKNLGFPNNKLDTQAEHLLMIPLYRIINPKLMNHPLQKHLVPWNVSFERHRLCTCKQSHYLCLYRVQSRAESAEPYALRVWEAVHLLAAGIRTQAPYLFSLGVVICNTEMSGEQC